MKTAYGVFRAGFLGMHGELMSLWSDRRDAATFARESSWRYRVEPVRIEHGEYAMRTRRVNRCPECGERITGTICSCKKGELL
jgi:hypothetical protein